MTYDQLDDLIDAICKEVAKDEGAKSSRPYRPMIYEYDDNGEPIEGSMDMRSYENIRIVNFDVPNGWRPGMRTVATAMFDLCRMSQLRVARQAKDIILLRAKDAVLSIKELIEQDARAN